MSPTFAYLVAAFFLIFSAVQLVSGADAIDTVILMMVWLAYAKGCEILEVLRERK